MMLKNLLAQGIRLISGVTPLSPARSLSGSAIYFANHSSHLDLAVVWAALPSTERDRLSPAAAEDYWGKSRFRRWIACDVFCAVLIPRAEIRRDNHPVDRLAEALGQGRSLLLFPEGTRRTDGVVGDFKGGLYHIAKRFPKVPLVPVYLENLSRILPKGSSLPVPLIAQAHFRQPIWLKDGEPKGDFLKRCRDVLLTTSNSD